MNDVTIKDGIPELGIFVQGEQALVSSRTLSDIFDKRHDHVLRDIESIISNADTKWTAPNFGLSKYKDASGKSNREYLLTRKAFTLVAMGFTGKKAIDFKTRYIDAFEGMSELIFTRLNSKQGYKEMSKSIHDHIGNSQKYYIREANMVNRIVLGMSAKNFREVNGVESGEPIRDAVVSERLGLLDKAQRLNAELINAGIGFDNRKSVIAANYKDGG